jgi:5,10-methylene-tetrahydrofolate dehydrogenase/methenyl tetrahydrofolate cyclohydrolase
MVFFVELVTHRMIKEGAIVIDVGISKSWTDKAVMKNKRFVGDVDFDGMFFFFFWQG